MRVLLVQQDMGRRLIKYPLFPIGLCYIATALKKHQVKIFDPNTYDFPDCYERLKEEVSAFQPEIVGISIRNIDTTQRRDLFVHFKTIPPTIQAVKAVNPDIKIMVGGSGFSFFSKEIMESVPEIDFGIYLEGEESTPELLDNLSQPERVRGIFIRKNGQLHFTGERGLPDFASLPIPRKDAKLIDISKYQGPLHNIIGIQSKRGCALSCTYCSYVFLNGNNVRLRDPRGVVDEIEQLVNEFKLRKFTFVDSIFNFPEKHAIDICREIISRKLDVEWGAWCNLSNLSEEFLRLAKQAGCKHIGFSPDAATNEGLSALKKGLTVNDIDNSLKILRKVKGIAAGYNFFCSYPGQNFKGMIKTLITIFKIPLLLPGRGGLGLGWIRIEPHTEMYELAVKENIIEKDADLFPKDEQELSHFFYTPSNLRYVDKVFDSVLAIIDSFLKPGVKFVFRLLKKGKSLYDS
jgi:anaerobic magnesium-protoporphyrin IX monomethyl ester cyclase